jgi:transcription termination factor Rho
MPRISGSDGDPGIDKENEIHMGKIDELESVSLAKLHELADRAGIKGFRKMRREDLVTELDQADVDAPSGSSGGRSGRSQGGRSQSGRRRRRSSGGPREKSDGRERESARDETFDLTEVTGVLEIVGRGSGLIRGEGIPDSGVYVSPSQIKRCELRSGDEVSGPVRPPRRGERRPSLTRVETVNGEAPDEGRGTAFERLTPVAPHRHIPLTPADDDVLARSVDLLAPLAFGQRVLVEAQPRSGRTGFLRSLATSIRAGSEEPPEVMVLLVDERPEEVTSWTRETEGVAIEAAPADLGAREQSRVAERVLSKVRRQAESGSDVVLIIDSLTRLASAFGEPGSVKPFFGTGRELEEETAGSVTVIATALWGAPGDQEVIDAVRTTENSTIKLSSELAAAGVFPSLEVAGCEVAGEGSVLSENEVAAVAKLRSELAGLDAIPAAERLAELIRETPDNAALLEKF